MSGSGPKPEIRSSSQKRQKRSSVSEPLVAGVRPIANGTKLVRMPLVAPNRRNCIVAIGGEFTQRLLTDAGIGSGMRVLDVGCGTGDVSLLAGELVGSSGSVIGIDREAGPLETAHRRAREMGLQTVTLTLGDLQCVPDDLGTFDAIVERRVLMYQPDTVQAVRKLIPSLRPGGLIVLQEHDTTMVPASSQAMPLHCTVQNWMKQTILREGADIHIGFNLHNVLTQAGLSVEHVRAEAIVQTPTQKHPVGSIIKAMLPRIVALGVATESEIDIDTLDERLDAERVNTNATYIGDVMFGAWARKLA